MATDLKTVCSRKLLIFAYFFISFHGFYLWKNSISTSLSNHKLLCASTNVVFVKTLINGHARWLTVKQRPLTNSSLKPVFGCRFLLYASYLSFTLISLSGDVQTNPGPGGSLNFLCQNVRSLKAKYHDSTTNCVLNKLSCLQDIVYGNSIDVIALVETWLSNHVSDVEILPVGYKVIRRDRQTGKRGGGVLLAVKDSIRTEPTDFVSDSLELASVVIKSSFNKVLVAVCYRPPDSSSEFLHELNRFLKFVADSQIRDVVLIGDFNYPNIQWSNGSGFSTIGSETSFIDIITDYSYLQLINSPTRGNNIIDLVLTTNEHLTDNIEVTDDDSISLPSDHKAITFDLKLHQQPKQSTERIVYNYSKGDFNGLINCLRNTPLVDIVLSEHADVNLAWSKWKDAFLAAVDSFVPKTKLKRSFTPPYITKDLLHAINMKESLRRKAKAKNSPQLWEKFRKTRQHVKCWINAKKREFLSGLSESVFIDSKSFWRFFKSKTSKSSLPDVIKLGGLKLSTAEEKADAFNSYFASVFNSDTNSSPISLSKSTLNSLDSIIVSESDVQSLLSNLSPSKATGPDGIPAYLLKRCSEVIAPSLAALFELSLQQGVFPDEWKFANVVPIPKKGDAHEVTNYRPVSLLSQVSKVLERLIFRQVSFFIKNALYDLQHGFRCNRSCVTQLLNVFHDLGRALDAGKEIDLIYLDFAKAFDSVSHSKLLSKLKTYGISGPLLNWFADYLRDRKQRVVIEGVSSSFLSVTSGVPQGSVIGPLLFILYVNDIPEVTRNSTVALFADDSKCFRTIQSPADRDLLQLDLDSMCNWSLSWQLKFNVSKTLLLRISRKRIPTNHSYYLNNDPVKSVANQVDLGVVVSNDLKWSPHIASCTAKANRLLGFLRRNCTQMTDTRCRRLLYLALVRSHLSYASEIWAPQGSSRDLALLEGVQRRATKFILQDYELSYPERLKELNLLPISYWLEIKDLVFFFKCKQGLYDVDISTFVTFSSLRSSRTRSSKDNLLQANPCRTSLFRNSFFNRIVFLWNNLSPIIRNSTSVSSFKHQLYIYYSSQLHSSFDVNRMRTWKTYCSKCRSYNLSCCS